jgi:hypothetical protein
MLGANPKKATTPSRVDLPGLTENTDGLMVKVIDAIFDYVKSSENPKEFKVSKTFYHSK